MPAGARSAPGRATSRCATLSGGDGHGGPRSKPLPACRRQAQHLDVAPRQAALVDGVARAQEAVQSRAILNVANAIVDELKKLK